MTNVLDNNFEKEKTPFSSKLKMVTIGILLPAILSVLIFYYLFGWELNYRAVFVNFMPWDFGFSDIALVTFLSVFLFIFLLPIGWSFISNEKRFYNTSYIIVFLFLIASFLLAAFGQVFEYPQNGWTAYPPLSVLPVIDVGTEEELIELVLEQSKLKKPEFKTVMVFISVIGVLSLGYLNFYKNRIL